jgi:hypothetical protein
MRTPGAVRTVDEVRVIIEFDQPTAEHWAGSVREDDRPDGPVPFDGRLQLLGLLEAFIVDRTASGTLDHPKGRT